MTFNVAHMGIEALIVHEIPRRLVGGGRRHLSLSEVESPLTPDVTNFFEERLQTALVDAHAAAFTGNPGVTATQTHSGAFLRGDTTFVDYSRAIAQRLFEVQTGVNSPGLLCVAHCVYAKHSGIALLKLEKEEGLRVSEVSIAGQRTMNVDHVRDLMLTNRTRIFKIAVIYPDGSDLALLVCDPQTQGQEVVAGFFLQEFLGARFLEAPEVLTQRFMRAVEDWIRTTVTDSETKCRYQVALMAELNSSRSTVTPGRFAADNLDRQDRDSFFSTLFSEGAPTKRFPKNTMLIRNRLRRVQFDLEGSISLTCPPDSVGDGRAVSISTDESSGDSLVFAKGRLMRVRGRGR